MLPGSRSECHPLLLAACADCKLQSRLQIRRSHRQAPHRLLLRRLWPKKALPGQSRQQGQSQGQLVPAALPSHQLGAPPMQQCVCVTLPLPRASLSGYATLAQTHGSLSLSMQGCAHVFYFSSSYLAVAAAERRVSKGNR